MPLEFHGTPAQRVAALKKKGKFCNAQTAGRDCVQTAVFKVVRVRLAHVDADGNQVPEGPEVTTQVCSKHRKFHINDPKYRQISFEDLPWRGRQEDRLGYRGRVEAEQRFIAEGGVIEHPQQAGRAPTPDLPTTKLGQEGRGHRPPRRATQRDARRDSPQVPPATFRSAEPTPGE